MSKSYFLIIFCLISISNTFSQNLKRNGLFELNCKLYSSSDLSTVYFSYENYIGDQIQDSVNVKNNKFIVSGKIKYPTLITLYKSKNFICSEKEFTDFYIEPNKMVFLIDPLQFSVIEFKGSQSQKDYDKLKNLKKMFFENQKSFYKLGKEYYHKIQIEKDSLAISNLEQKLKDLAVLNNKNEQDELYINLKFAAENPKSFIVPDILSYTLDRDDKNISVNQIETILLAMDKSVKKSESSKKLIETVFFIKNSSVGSKAPNFDLKEIEGTIVSLKKFDGKCILIDFWASWCSPCIEDFPFVKELFTTYKAKGLEVISLSYHDDIESWKKNILKHGIQQFINISLEQNRTTLDRELHITSIPAKILISKKGIIIGRWFGKDENFNIEISKMIENELQQN